LSEAEVDKIRIAAQLHDVGKIGIEDAVLKKPGALTPEEYEIHEDSYFKRCEHTASRRALERHAAGNRIAP
jgi:response regulator RpfG family c-di-GMP phosphodiesterase